MNIFWALQVNLNKLNNSHFSSAPSPSRVPCVEAEEPRRVLGCEDTYAPTGLCKAQEARQWLKFSHGIKVLTLNLQLFSKPSSNFLYQAGSEFTELEGEQESI